jgi:hypothetical protein
VNPCEIDKRYVVEPRIEVGTKKFSWTEVEQEWTEAIRLPNSIVLGVNSSHTVLAGESDGTVTVCYIFKMRSCYSQVMTTSIHVSISIEIGIPYC